MKQVFINITKMLPHMVFPTKIKLFLCLLALMSACTSVHVTTQSPTITSTVTPPLPTVTPSTTPLPPPQAVDLGVIGKGSATDVIWSPDGSLLAVISSTGTYLYDTRTWEVVKKLTENDFKGKSLGKLTFSSTGTELALATWNSPPAFWRYNLRSGEFRFWFEDASLEWPSSPLFSPDGETFAILNSVCENIRTDGEYCSHPLELRDSVTGKLIYRLPKGSSEQNNEINQFIFSPDGKQIAGASNDNRVRVWDTASGSLLYELRHDSNVAGVCYSPDGKILASASKDATVRFWDPQTGKSLSVLRGFKQELQQVAYIENGKKLLVGELYSNSFHEYALDDHYLPVNPLDVVMEINKDFSGYFDADVANTLTAKISPDTRRIAVLSNATVQIYNLDSGKLVLTLIGYNSAISGLAFSPDGSLMAIADHDIQLWDVPTRTWIATLPANIREIHDIAFRPNSHQVAIAGDGDVQFWDTRTYQKIKENSADIDWCNSSRIAFSPDGKKLATAGGCGIRIWTFDTVQLEQKLTVEERTPYQLAFSPDGTELLFVDEHGFSRWDLKTGQPIYSIDLSSGYGYWSVALGPNLMILGKEPDGPFLFFDPITGQHLYDFAKNLSGNNIALHPDQRLFAQEYKLKILLTDSASGKGITSINFDASRFIVFSPDRRTLAAGSYENTVHLWDIAAPVQRVAGAVSPTATPVPELTSTPTIPELTSSPTLTPEPIRPLSIQPLPTPTPAANAIRPENIAKVAMLHEFGLGLGLGPANVAAWSTEGKTLAIVAVPGIYIFEFGAEQPLHFLPSEQIVFRLAFSPDGRLLAGQISNDFVQVWEIATYRSLYTLKNVGCWNRELVFSPDSQILSAGCGGETYRWNMTDGQLLSKKESAYHTDVSPDGHLAVDVNMNLARLVSADNGEIIQTFDVPDMAPGQARFSPDGKTLLVSFYQFEIARSGIYFPGKDHKSLVQLWNIAPNQPPSLRATLASGKWYYSSSGIVIDFHGLAFSPDSRRVFVASGDGQVQIWDTTSGNLMATLPDGKQIYLSSDGSRLTTLGRKIQVWDVSPGKTPLVLWSIPGFGEFQSLLALTGKNHDMVTAFNGEFRFWARSGTAVAKQPTIVTAPDSNVRLQSVSPDGKWLAYSTATDLMLGENNSAHPNWRSLEKFSDKSCLGCMVIVFSPDSSRLVVIDADRKIWVWQLNEPHTAPLELAHDLAYVANLIFSPDGQFMIGAPNSSTGEASLYLWDTISGKLLRTWKMTGHQFTFHPDGVTLAVSEYAQGKILLFDLRTWKLVREIQGQKYAGEIAFSPDGSLLAISNSAGLEVWDVINGTLLKTIQGSFGRLIFSPDGKELIVSLSDGRIQIWGLPE
jgi:WD40 repeat protein